MAATVPGKPRSLCGEKSLSCPESPSRENPKSLRHFPSFSGISLVEARMTPQPAKPDQDYLNRHADLLHAMAWNGFLKHGRGTVVVQEVGGPKEQMVFLPLKVMASNPLCQVLDDMARAYSPLTESVVVFIRRPFGITAYAVSGHPPEDYEQLASMLFGNKGCHGRTSYRP